jgi:hypothetical protein
MLRTTCRLTALAVTLFVAGTATADPPGLVLQTDEAALLTPTEWIAYSERISDALASGQDGLREAALRMTVLYADRLSLDHGDTIEMIRLFRDHGNDRMRRLAVVALHAADDHWGIEMLARSYRFEDCPQVRYQIGAVLLDHAKRHREGVIEVEHPRAIVVWPVE